MATALLRYEGKDVSFSNELLIPVINETTQLKGLAGVDLCQLFNLLNLGILSLRKPARLWPDDLEHQKARKMTNGLSIVNDSAERALDLVSEFHTSKITKDSQQK